MSIALRRKRPTFRPRLELLESRLAPVANLQIVRTLLVDGSNSPITAPVVGQMIVLRAEWQTTDLTNANTYLVRFSVDGVPIDSAMVSGQAGQNLSYFWWLGGWYASPGNHTVQVTVDGTNAVTEENELDNSISFSFTAAAPATLPGKFVWPVGGRAFKDWSVVNYLDVNPLPNQTADFRGGPYQYDGHGGIDITLPNFARMDAGVPVLAAAAGTVIEVVDSYFDRETTSNSNPANYVRVDHGNGWSTLYIHAVRGSIAVKVGDRVETGQFLGFAGSSGSSTDAHLHFQVTYQGVPVETYLAPASYWIDALPYQGDRAPTVTDSGISNASPFADIKERPLDVQTFPTSYTGSVWFWYRLSHLAAGDRYDIKWYRPDGSLDGTYPNTASAIERYAAHGWVRTRPWGSFPGTWHAALEVNGVEIARNPFTITGTGVPVIQVTQQSATILNRRTTPLNLGSAAVGAAAPQLTLAVANRGTAPLTLSNAAAPPGFSLVGNLPTNLAPGATANVTLQLDTLRAGEYFGAFRFTTNDPSTPTFSFNVLGTVAGGTAPGTPTVGLPSPALAYHVGGTARVIDPLASVVDPNSTRFSGGRLTVEVAVNGTADDVLGVRHQGTGSGMIGVTGTTVTYAGNPIGTLSGGSGGLPLLVQLQTTSATLAAVQALARAITYFAPATVAARPRYVRFSLVDDTGLTSNSPIKMIDVFHSPPTLTPFTDRSIPEDTSTGAISFIIGDAQKPIASLFVTARSSNPLLVPDANIVLSGSGPSRTLTVTPLAQKSGRATISVTVMDVNGGSVTESFVLTVGSVNDPPTAVADTFTLNEDTPTTVNVLANDTDPDGDSLSIASFTQGTHGAVEQVGTQLRYSPERNYSGPDSFTYTISDGQGGTSTQTVTLNIKEVNAPPTPANDTATVAEDGTTLLDVMANDTDRDGDPLVIREAVDPTYGSVVVEGTQIRYTPDPNYYGPDSFTYTVDDGRVMALATVLMTVTPANDPPVAVGDTATSNRNDTVLVSVLDNDTLGPDRDETLRITSIGPASHGTTAMVGTQVRYTPNPGYVGPDSFTYTIADDLGATATATVAVTVIPNDRPSPADDPVTVAEDGTALINVLANDTDIDGDPLAIPSASTPRHGSALVQGSIIRYVPALNYHGSDSFTYTVSDGRGGIATATVNVTVYPVNDSPVVHPRSAPGAEESPSIIDVRSGASPGPANEAGQKLIVKTATALHGRVTINTDQSLTYTPFVNYHGPDTITYTLMDDGTTNGVPDPRTTTGTVAVTVAPINDPPVNTVPRLPVRALHDRAVRLAGANAVSVTDVDGNKLTVTLTATNGTLRLTPTARLAAKLTLYGDPATVNRQLAGLTFVPRAGFVGRARLTVATSDRVKTVASAVTLEFTDRRPVRSAIAARASAYALRRNIPLSVPASGGLRRAFSDPDKDPLTIRLAVGQPPVLGLMLSKDGSFRYVPRPNYRGKVMFRVQAFDGALLSDPLLVTLTVL